MSRGGAAAADVGRAAALASTAPAGGSGAFDGKMGVTGVVGSNEGKLNLLEESDEVAPVPVGDSVVELGLDTLRPRMLVVLCIFALDGAGTLGGTGARGFRLLITIKRSCPISEMVLDFTMLATLASVATTSFSNNTDVASFGARKTSKNKAPNFS